MKKIEMCKNNKYGTFKINNWFNECKRENKPYVIVRYKTTYSTIEWDYINLSMENEETLISRSEDLRKRFLEIFHNHCGKKSHYSISHHIVTYENIPYENAEKMAIELYDTIEEFILKGAKK